MPDKENDSITMGRTAVIIGNGAFPNTEYPLYLIRTADIIICCDGASESFFRRRKRIFGNGERLPDAIVGDMDSTPASFQEKYSHLIIKVSEQENNDQTKALLHLLEKYGDIERIHILGATGKREDHTIGNLSLLMEYATDKFGLAERGISIDMVSDYSTAFAVTDSCELHIGQGRSISIISPDNSLKIKSEGLVWKTDDVVFDNLWKATLNKAETDAVRLTFSHKSIALIILG